MEKYIKEFRSDLRYAYKHSALNMLGKANWTNLTSSEIKRVLSYLLETYYPIRPYRPGQYEPITKDEFMTIFGDTFKNEIKKMKSGNPLPESLYRAFHGNPPKRVRTVEYKHPKKLLKIGRLTELRYTPEAPSQHTGTEFSHRAGDNGSQVLRSNSILCTNPEGTELYIIKDRKMKRPYFSGRGIIG